MASFFSRTWVKVTVCVFCILLVSLAVVETVYLNRTYSVDEMKKSAVKVEHRVGYALVADGKDILYFTEFSDDSLFVGLDTVEANVLRSYNSTGVWINDLSFAPSCEGMVLTRDYAPNADSIARAISADVDSIVRLNVAKMKLDVVKMKDVKHELDYYLSVHDPMDGEFDRVSAFATKNNSSIAQNKRYAAVLTRVMAESRLSVRAISKYSVSANGISEMQNVNCRVLPYRGDDDGKHKDSKTNAKKDESVYWLQKRKLPREAVILQTDSMYLPDGAYAVSLPLFVDFKYEMTDTVYVVKYGKKTLRRVPLSKAYADYPMFSDAGRFQGFTPSTCHHVDEADTLGYKVLGKANVDSLLKGTFTDDLGTYRGYMTYDGEPNGLGVFRYSDGGYYEGEWLHGQRHGNGFYVKHGEMVKAGEWKEGKYRGERMVYNAYRVYGIDISRYQHEIGRRRYNIDWDKLRITYLGAKNSGDAVDTIDYPVSFVYIKSTQGTSIKSRYYLADANAARRHGILCGAYHFYSMKTKALDQAKYFLKNTQIRKSDLPPVLDVEPTNREIVRFGGEQKLFESIRVWMETVERHTGKRPILYVSQQFIREHLVNAPDICDKYQVWIARYGAYRPEVKLLFWQLTPYGRVSGIHGDVDINVFNGYQDQFEQFSENLRM